MNTVILPQGEHWGLDINTHGMFSTGSMSPGAEPKLILHTTEGLGFAAMDRVLREKRAEPHVLIDPVHRLVKQYIPLNQYAKALEHPSGTPETNRAGCVQVEIVGFAAPSPDHRDVAEESMAWYANLASLCELLRHRARFTTTLHQFTVGARRIPATQFNRAKGIMGHMHVPSQPSGHWDPGRLRGDRLIHLMAAADKHYA